MIKIKFLLVNSHYLRLKFGHLLFYVNHNDDIETLNEL
jgi:hypothetical protein